MDSAAHVAQLVRRGDPDRYLSTLYAPEEKRASLLALYAFSHEIAAIRSRVREPLAGEIRLQWWRDTIAGGPEAGQGSPVAEALLAAIDRHDLPAQPFVDLLDARVFDLYDDPMPSRNDLEGYCGETSSALFQIACLVLDAGAARDAATLSGHAGCAFAIAEIARLMPYQLARGQCYVPLDILSSVGQTPQEFVARGDRQAGALAMSAFAALGREHATAFATDANKLPTVLRPAFLPMAPVPAYLDKVERKGADALDRPVDISPIRRHWITLRRAIRGWG